MTIVINNCYGGFELSEKAEKMLGLNQLYDDVKRTDEKLIDCVRKLGEEANGYFANLKVVELPDNCTDYEIVENDGWETLYYVVDGKIHSV